MHVIGLGELHITKARAEKIGDYMEKVGWKGEIVPSQVTIDPSRVQGYHTSGGVYAGARSHFERTGMFRVTRMQEQLLQIDRLGGDRRQNWQRQHSVGHRLVRSCRRGVQLRYPWDRDGTAS